MTSHLVGDMCHVKAERAWLNGLTQVPPRERLTKDGGTAKLVAAVIRTGYKVRQ